MIRFKNFDYFYRKKIRVNIFTFTPRLFFMGNLGIVTPESFVLMPN